MLVASFLAGVLLGFRGNALGMIVVLVASILATVVLAFSAVVTVTVKDTAYCVVLLQVGFFLGACGLCLWEDAVCSIAKSHRRSLIEKH